VGGLGFSDNPIINSPFEKPKCPFELDGDGQSTGKKLPDRRESIYVAPDTGLAPRRRAATRIGAYASKERKARK
jgi:hypothetical protein